MKTVFISYSSFDRTFAEKLSADLRDMGIGVWFDQWEIKVGDSLVEKIAKGIEENDFLAVVLSPASLESNWVNKELRTALYREIEQKSVFVLPILLSNCDLPLFLKEKKYADFRENYEAGLKQILNVILKDDFKSNKSLDMQLADFHVKKALEFEENSDFKEAQSAYEKAINTCPTYDEPHLHLGVLYSKTNNLLKAKNCLLKALECNSNNPNTLINLGGLSIGLGDWEKAITYFEKVLAAGESGYIVRRQLGQALIEVGHYNEAIENLRNAIEQSPGINEYIFVCYLLYQAYEGIGSFESYGYALAYLEEFAIKLGQVGKDDIDLHLNISEKFLIANMPDKATEFLKRAMAFDVSNPKVNELSRKISNFNKSLESMGVRRVINATSTNYESGRINIIRSLDKLDGVYLFTSAETGGSPIAKRVQKLDEENT
jgi:tetratricopeptide (TPR) repeat protein